MRKTVLSVIVALALLVAAVPAYGIVYGEFDGNKHPNVGAMLFEYKGVKEPICSGTLIDPKYFLTAAHCTTYLEGQGITDVWVSFDATYDPATSKVIHGKMHSNPNYGQNQDDPGDIALIELDQKVTWLTPAKLPTASLFDQMNVQNGLKDQLFRAVGYGIHEPEPGKGGIQHADPLERWTAVSSFSALNPGWLRLQQNQATGDGGTCNGDSGGPNFIGETDVLAGLTITGDMECFATNVVGRLDIPSARNFLKDYVKLP
jgi:hypothetical protein